MRTFTTFLTTSIVLACGVLALPQTDPIPPAGLYCCPPTGPNDLPLNRQQNNPYTIFCYYDDSTDEGCFYNPGTGAGGGPAAGCPTQAPANFDPSTHCPGVQQ